MSRLLSHRGKATEAFASALGTAIAFGESIYSNSQEHVVSPYTRSVWPIDPISCDADCARDIYAEWSQGFMEACSLKGDYGVRIRLAATRGRVLIDVVRF
tara:strand:- start:53 stop:352 length:300 start_codon:yes stop_codon:yes gene_type:complete